MARRARSSSRRRWTPEKEFVDRRPIPRTSGSRSASRSSAAARAGWRARTGSLQLLAEDEALMERSARCRWRSSRRARARGSHLLSGAMMQPVRDAEAVPGPDPRATGRRYGEVDKDAVYCLAERQAGAAAEARPRRRSATTATTSPRSPSSAAGSPQQAEEAGVYILTETSRLQAARRGRARRGRALGRQGPRPRRRGALQLRARLRPDRRRRPSSPRARPATSPARRSATSTSAPRTRSSGSSASRRSGRSRSRSTA